MQSDWDASAEAWIESLKTGGDFSRVAVLDRPILAVVYASGARRVLDVGCGEGRFCRMISETVPQVVGLDPTARLLSEARKLGGAQYAQGRAEDMPFEDRDFDIVVSYLSLIDIPDNAAAIAEMARVVRPGGYVLIANLNSWVTADQTKGRGVVRNKQGHSTMTVANYLTPHWYWAKWRGVKSKTGTGLCRNICARLYKRGCGWRIFRSHWPMRDGPAVKVIITSRTFGFSCGANRNRRG